MSLHLFIQHTNPFLILEIFSNHTIIVLCLVAQSCLTLCDPTDCSPPGSSVHEIRQAKVLEWVAIPFSRGSSQPRDRTCASCLTDRFFNPCPTWKTLPFWDLIQSYTGGKRYASSPEVQDQSDVVWTSFQHVVVGRVRNVALS